jgi:hypothetical protein
MAKEIVYMGRRETYGPNGLESVEEIPDPPKPTVISAEEFLLRFTILEMVAIDKSDDVSVTMLKLRLQARQQIDLEGAELGPSLDLLVAKGYLTEDRKKEILTP